jgi:hypothetical protein
MTSVPSKPQSTPTNPALDEHVARVLGEPKLSPEQVQAALVEARKLAGQQLSAAEDDAFVALRDGLQARGLLSPEQAGSLQTQIESERQLRGAHVEAAIKAGRKNAVLAGVVGVVVSVAALAGFAVAPSASDAAGLLAAGHVTANLLTLMTCRAFSGGAELKAERYGVNEHEPKPS